jgi:hypothetical protein
VFWKLCSTCWSSHLLREEFLSAPIHSLLSSSPNRSFSIDCFSFSISRTSYSTDYLYTSIASMACFSFPFTFSSSVVVALSFMLAYAHSFFMTLPPLQVLPSCPVPGLSTLGQESHLFLSIGHCLSVTYGHTTSCSCCLLQLFM